MNNHEELMKEWKKPFDWDAETVKWFKSRPQVIKDLLVKFPPDCLVKGTRPLGTPAKGETGIIASYFENGLVSVVVPGKEIKAQCQAEWLEVVEYRKGSTPEDVKKILGKGN